MTHTIDELLPCPWCGELPTIIYKEAPSNIVRCEYYACKIKPSSDNECSWAECVHSWNTRTHAAQNAVGDDDEAILEVIANQNWSYGTNRRKKAEVILEALRAAGYVVTKQTQENEG